MKLKPTGINERKERKMLVAIYEENTKLRPELIKVHKYASDGLLRVEAIGVGYAHEVGGAYKTIREVEQYLSERSKIFGYTRIALF